MEIQGEVSLASMVWLTQSPEAAVARALGACRADAEWLVTGEDGARVLVRGESVDVEPRMGPQWAGLVMGRVSFGAPAPGSASHAFEPYALEPPPPPMRLESCWFAIDREGRVGCFERDQLGAAPMRRCWGPRPAPPTVVQSPESLARNLRERHAVFRAPARAFTFVADAQAFAREFERASPQSASRKWSLSFHGETLVATTADPDGEPLPPAFSAWLHSRGLCLGCARSPMRDARVRGAFVYAHRGRRRAAPYERLAEPVDPWTVQDAAAVLKLSPESLARSALPLTFAEKDCLQPIEYVPCTWSDTMPWESESGERHGEG